MMLVVSRFVDASTMLKNSSTYSTSPSTSNPTAFLNNKHLASYKLHAAAASSITRNFNYNPSRWTFVVRNNITPPDPPLPSGSLRNLVVGIVLTFVLPFIAHKWGPLILLKNKVETVMETTEQVMEAIEAVAKGADEIIDDITDTLPENSKLKETMEAVDVIVEGVAKTAHIANQIIDKVEESEEKLESLILDQQKSEEELLSKGVILAKKEELKSQPKIEPTAQN